MPDTPERPADPPPRNVRVEDTSDADVADAAANAATDELIDHAEADPVRPGEPADAHSRREGRSA